MEAYINDVEALLISLSKQNEILNRNILDLYTRIENIESRLPKIKDEDKRRINMEFMKIIVNNKKHESNEGVSKLRRFDTSSFSLC